MAKGEIAEAAVRMRKRQRSAGLTEQPGSAITEKSFRLIFSGMDLDIEEVKLVKEQVEEATRLAIEADHEPSFVAAGMFLDGLGIGLMIADARMSKDLADE
jgi:hypothetical protein